MKKITFVAITIVTFFVGCSKNDTQSPADDSAPHSKTAGLTSSVTYTDESSFVNSLSSYGFLNPSQLTYNRDATSSGYASVYGFNIPTANRVKGFKWNPGDEQTRDWRPQGIAGFTWGNRKYILTTWYGVGPDPNDSFTDVHNQHKGVRIAIADVTDMSNITYRHILLVQNKANMSNSLLFDTFPQSTNPYTQGDLYAAVTIHAGGVAFYNNKIYVADTGRGVRVFDLNNFIAVSSDSSSQIGKMSNGTLQAFNYGYILPETGWYSLTGAAPYSCVELGEGTRLWFGQYLTSGSPKVTGYALDTGGQISTGTPSTVNPIDNTGTPVFRVQGVYRKGTQTFMTTTGNSTYEGSTARLVRYNDGTSLGSRYRWPHGSEDLYYESSTGYLWCLTEYETNVYGSDNRCVFAVRLSDYD